VISYKFIVFFAVKVCPFVYRVVVGERR